ncbi:hypothetical protein FJT64_021728 [Amphibalanus amphitrite]|uniref:Uncharacterized protein n=1 Tax=Amphibalanus amphitrite TaxID=1232801 RepID=A0A6A4WSQ4_AMPAM|nr:hypothetical protein FJT64_021728 [Amphibalanus amphitrite]
MEVSGGAALHLLGVTFGRLLHFGAHCDELRKEVGRLYSSTRREVFVLGAALEDLISVPNRDMTPPVTICLEFKVALAVLKNGSAVQVMPVAADIWNILQDAVARGADKALPPVRGVEFSPLLTPAGRRA